MAIGVRPIRSSTTSVIAASSMTLLPLVRAARRTGHGLFPARRPGASLLRDPTVARIGAAHNCSAAAVALAWTIRNGNVIAIPESGSAEHVKENAVALSLTFTSDELQR